MGFSWAMLVSGRVFFEHLGSLNTTSRTVNSVNSEVSHSKNSSVWEGVYGLHDAMTKHDNGFQTTAFTAVGCSPFNHSKL